MDLLEYQAKELFKGVGIPTLPSQTISNPTDLKKLQIPYPVVLKSQVKVGGRGKAGGIRFVENTIDAIAAARTIFNLAILGEYPDVILSEARFDAQQEFFLAIVLDYNLQRPVLIGSPQGGMDIKSLVAKLEKVVIDEPFSPFYARRLVFKMGLEGKLIHSVSTIIEKMYQLFVGKDLDLIEINPLGVGADGEVMALDGKITINNYALGRHSDILHLTAPKKKLFQPTDEQYLFSPLTAPRWLDWRNERGKIAIICNSHDLALLIWDLLSQDKAHPACCLVVGVANNRQVLSPSILSQQLETALQQLDNQSKIKTVLINIVGSEATEVKVIDILSSYLATESSPQQSKSRRHTAQSNPALKLVVRLAAPSKTISAKIKDLDLEFTEDLEVAIAKTVSLSKSK